MGSIDDIVLNINKYSDESGYVSNSLPLWLEIATLVDNCMVPALPVAFDELYKPLEDEYKEFIPKLQDNIQIVDAIIALLSNKKLQQPMNVEFIASMVLLVEQINAVGSWSLLYKNSNNIVVWFETQCDVYSSSHETFRENVFGTCMKKYHPFLTQEKWKQYPALMESYRAVVENMCKFGKINCSLHIAFPVTLMQLDDYDTVVKIKGLQCCNTLLTNLNFTKSGYEEVIYDSLMKLLRFKGLSTLPEVMNCILLIMPLYLKENTSEWTKCDDIVETILDSVYMEMNRDRKNIYMKFLPKFIIIMKNSIIRWKKKILKVLCDGMDIYLSNGYDHEYLNNCVKCLLEWLRIGWPVWSYYTDHLVLVRLFKLLYMWCDDNNVADKVDMENLKISIITILTLYTDALKCEVFDQSEESVNELGVKFANLWNEIKDNVLDVRTCAISDKISSLSIENEKTIN